MTDLAARALAATRALDAVMRQDRGRLMAALIRRLGDFQLAEDALQEAMASAVLHWGRNGLPGSPQGWLLQVAGRKAIDRIRAGQVEQRKAAALQPLLDEAAEVAEDEGTIPDERLRLIFTCCHPALDAKSRIALTLRVVCGLSTEAIAAAFLDQPTTMGQRLTRAKARIAAAGIPYAVPAADQFADRLDGVLTVIYLIFNAGYSAGPQSGTDLMAEALYLIGVLDDLLPDTAEVEGCFALMLQARARQAARLDDQGATVPPEQQDRRLWDQALLIRAQTVLAGAMARGTPGPHQLRAMIALCHVLPDRPDWPRIAALYDHLFTLEPTPVVALNRAVSRMETGQLSLAARDLAGLAPDLADYPPFHAADAALAARLGDISRARAAYEMAILRASSPADARFLTKKRDALQ